MGIDLYSVQKSIKEHIETEFPGYDVIRNGALNDEGLERDESGQVKNYIVLRFGTLRQRGAAFGGVRNSDYYSVVDVNVVSRNEDWAAQTLNVVRDDLLGWKPEGGEEMGIDTGMSEFPIRNSSNRPTAYVSSQRFRYGINQGNQRLRMPRP